MRLPFRLSSSSSLPCFSLGALGTSPAFGLRLFASSPFPHFCLVSVSLVSVSLHAADKLDYNRDIRPILSENCFSCHGFDEKSRKAKLRLDRPEDAYADRKGFFAIKPGDPDNSDVVERIFNDDPEEIMPPPKSHLKLSEDDKAKIKRWISEGGKYDGHWSFQAPVKPAVPGDAKVSPIDAFVRQKLAAQKLTPASEALRPALLRRLSLDLTGLPPSAAEIAAFVQDKDPQAYAKQVDRLLSSPHFGERVALEWLDSARYSDTNGFSIDGGRHMWLWRDWVINAFNTNKPYDQFLVEQIAGDLLPNRTQDQLVASGFQRNNMVTHEGGTIPEENLTNYNVDRVKTYGEAVLGLTLGCCQCHDHKFDPISQKDYFSVYAYFNTLSDKGLDGNAGVNPAPYAKAKTILKTGEEGALQADITRLQAALDNPPADAVAAWEKQQLADLAVAGKNLRLLPAEALKVSTPNSGSGYNVVNNQVVLSGAPGFAAYDVSLKLPETKEPITGLRVIFHPEKDDPKGDLGHAKPRKSEVRGTFSVTSLTISSDMVPSDQINLFRNRELSRATASHWAGKERPEGVLDTASSSGWMPDISQPGPAHLTVTFEEPINSATHPYAAVQVNFGKGGSNVARRFSFQAMTGRDDGSVLDSPTQAALKTPAASRTPEQTKIIRAAFAELSPALRRTRVDLANARERLDVLTKEFTTMVMDVSEKPRKTFVLNRGDYAQPTTQEVFPATPGFLPGLKDAPANRLGLAQWTVMKENPLTARVAVNRFWQMLFGIGIVKSSADFGAQGEWPSHPALLDWLTVDFVENGWDVKRLVRQIVLSETYRQDSKTSPALLDLDHDNRLLARGSRFRLPAEFIRDNFLKTSGLLVPRLGGPSVNPYTPGDPWREVSHYGSTPATAQAFIQDHGEKLYRRSLYTYWKRTSPPPSMVAFDAPNREVCTVNRALTNTPLQALVLLNDPQFVEAARAFAERILRVPGDDPARLRWAFTEALSREPSAKESKLLAEALAKSRARYTKDKAAALAYLSVGESLRDEKLPVPEHAAWTELSALILNLSENITRN